MFSSKINCRILVNSAANKFLLPVPSAVTKIQVATMKATFGEKYPYSEPFPYQLKQYNVFRAVFDKTKHRFNENSKLIVVEGNIGVGKSNFAKRLATGFDMKYMEPLPDDAVFTSNSYGFDIRTLNDVLPKSAKFYDLVDFYRDPHPEKGLSGRLLLNWYKEKWFYYCNAMKHILSTGQGVVMATSVFSDSVFVNAINKMGWCTNPFVKYYNDFRAQSICELYKPHLTIYLDTPISVVRERINKRKHPKEVGARNLTDDYLKAIEDEYKQKFLPSCKKYGEVVEIDWIEVANDVDMDVIIEELQWLNLETEDQDDEKFEDWCRNDDAEFMKKRMFLENEVAMNYFFSFREPWECPEMLTLPDDNAAIQRLIEEHPAFRYAPGWAPELGHKVMFKP